LNYVAKIIAKKFSVKENFSRDFQKDFPECCILRDRDGKLLTLQVKQGRAAFGEHLSERARFKAALLRLPLLSSASGSQRHPIF
jgi:hypothetical protein